MSGAPPARCPRSDSHVIFGKGKGKLTCRAQHVRSETDRRIAGKMPDLSGRVFCHVDKNAPLHASCPWRLQDERSTHFLVVPGSAISAFSRTPGRLIFAAVNLPFDLIALREEYFTKGLRRIDLDPDPIKEFGIWFTAAVEVGISEMNAMALATVAENGQPTTRMVLLKGYDHDGFVFYTNYLSEKGLHLEKNPRAGLVIHWKELERQIRIDGIAEKVSREESARYFHSRPLGSQLGAWVSHQSEVIDARRILEARLSELEERFAGQEIPCPPYWGGYRVKPDRIEFWQGRPNRLHDRFRYTRQGKSWRIERLAP